MPYPKAMIIDLDDTIVNATDSGQRLWDQLARDHAAELGQSPQALREAIRKAEQWYWGDPRRADHGRIQLFDARRDMIRNALQRLGIDRPDLATALADDYTRLRLTLLEPFDGAIEAIKHFKSRGIRLALISNGKAQTQRAKVTQFNLEDLFDVVLIEGELGYGKPDPRIFELALQRLGVSPEETWVIGDNLEWEVAAPQALGMYAIWHDWENVGLPAQNLGRIQPDRIIHRLSELVHEA